MKRAHLLMIGPFPPPRHGVSAVNEAVQMAAMQAGIEVRRYDTAPTSLDRSLGVRLRRLGKIAGAFKVLRAFGREHPAGTVYLSLSGGLGLLSETCLVWAARAAGLSVMVHHHSFRYLDRPYWPMRLLVRTAGPQALHVVLGQNMGEKLRQRYPRVGRVTVMNNAALVGPPLPAMRSSSPNPPLAVGFLANLSQAKGLDDMLQLAELAQRVRSTMRFKIAGPFENPADESRYRRRFAELANLDYAGPVYGEAKEAFWQHLAVFAFPTRYRNEADPLVVHEALRHGKPVIALGRGCIAAQVGDAGHVLPPEGDFAHEAWRILSEWASDAGRLDHLQRQARDRYAALHRESLIALAQILQQIKSTPTQDP
jgi:glycosyltransferase involved in cell wall biosynthesis